MTNYEAIKRMSKEEVAAMLYLFARPFFELLKMDNDSREEAKKDIRAFLDSEVKEKK